MYRLAPACINMPDRKGNEEWRMIGRGILPAKTQCHEKEEEQDALFPSEGWGKISLLPVGLRPFTQMKKIPSAHILGKFQIKPPYSIAMLNTYSVETTAVSCPWGNRKSVKIKQFFCTLYSFATGLRIHLPRRSLRNESWYLEFNCYECFWSNSKPLFNKHGYCSAAQSH